MKTRTTVLFLFLMILLMIVSSCSSGASNTTPGPTVALDGATLVQERCSVCHPLSRIEANRRTTAEWKTIVNMMISRGAQLTPEEESVVVSYLASNFGK